MKKKALWIPKSFYTILKELAANNNREWFNMHKQEFETVVFQPFKTLTESVIELMQEIDPDIQIDYKEAAFRFYRDTRFTQDKSPYKLWMGAVVNRMGRKNTRYPELYFQLGPGENFIATGLYRPDKETLYKIREGIASNPTEFEALFEDEKFKACYKNGLLGERNKRLPVKEWQEIAKNYPLILNKQFYAIKYYRPEEMLRPDLPEFIVEHYVAMQKFNHWLLRLNQ